MKVLFVIQFTMLLLLCSCVTRPPSLMHNAWQKARSSQSVQINTPVSMAGQVDEKDGTIGVTKVEFCGDVGWAIDYSVMFIARSIDKGKTWRIVMECGMPWGLHVVSADCAWVWDLYTTETEWEGAPNSVYVTQDGGKTWHALPPLVDWLYNVEVETSERAVVIGRVKPDTWSQYSDPLTLPLSRFETRDGGKTFREL